LQTKVGEVKSLKLSTQKLMKMSLPSRIQTIIISRTKEKEKEKEKEKGEDLTRCSGLLV
jgi:precorrin-4 methylase